VRIVDRLLRQGHLSERALTEAVITGRRPDHVDRCELCSERAFELGRWLDRTRDEAVAAADVAFPPERLAVQQNQILRRLAQLEEPVRVIEFPRQHAPQMRPVPRRVSPAWLGVAAAAGLVVGVAGGHFTAHLGEPPAPVAATAGSDRSADQVPLGPGAPVLDVAAPPATTQMLFDLELENAMPPSLQPLDENTPRLTQIAMN
jgi:hypothetical protein